MRDHYYKQYLILWDSDEKDWLIATTDVSREQQIMSVGYKTKERAYRAIDENDITWSKYPNLGDPRTELEPTIS